MVVRQKNDRVRHEGSTPRESEQCSVGEFHDIGSNPIGATLSFTDVKRCQKVRIRKWSKQAVRLFFLLLYVTVFL